MRPVASYGLMLDPASPAGLRVVADTTLPAALRVSVAGTIAGASCLNTREVLLGPDVRRDDAVEQAARSLSDVPGAGDMVRIELRWLELWRRDPVLALHVVQGRSGRLRPSAQRVTESLDAVGADRLAARLALCAYVT
jgi:hypothetical protein